MSSMLTRKLKDLRHQFPGACHRYGLVMMRLLARHCEFLATQRIRRTSQIVMLYSKIWNETAIEKMMERLRHQAGARGKMLLLGAAILRAHGQYDWNKERVSNFELEALFSEFDDTRSLLGSTESCRVCGKRRVFDKAVSWETYCNCRHKGKPTRTHASHGWEAFLERSDVVIWRRPLGSRNYEYRVFGKYNDVCAGAWFRINADDENRKDWDDTCLEIRQIDQDPDSRTHVLYWRSQYPFPMSNRDYVFKKNYVLDRKRRMALIFNHDTVHPLVPETKDNVRIKRYRSIIAVRPYTEFHQDGMEFSISYTDDPGVELPEIFISYVTVQGFPNYVDKMRNAAKKLEKAVGREVMSVENLMAYFGITEEESVVEAPPPEETDSSMAGADLGAEEPLKTSSPIARIFIDKNFRNPDSDFRRAANLLRNVLGIKEKRPESAENIVITVSPALLRRPAYRNDTQGDDNSPSSAMFAEVTDSDAIESYRENDAEGGSAGSYWTYWIPLSWLKRAVNFLPVSSMESSGREK